MILFCIAMFIVFLNNPLKAYAYDGYSLDDGLYWFGMNNESQKFEEGVYNRYFDPSKPTIIYIHGWENGSTPILFRETFNPNKDSSVKSLNINLADKWVQEGWNIGIFYWDQFSDEREVKDAEAKIWSINGNKRLRWRTKDGQYHEYTGFEKSTAEIFVNIYSKAMKNYYGSEIRFAGHSLGNQMVTNSAQIISDKIERGELAENLLPNRVALLDPFWSKGSKSYLDDKWTGERCREIVTNLKRKNVVFEQYKSSNINDYMIGDSNNQMRRMIVFTDVYPDYLSRFAQGRRHGAAKVWYFYSYSFNSPQEIINNIPTGNAAPSARISTDQLRGMQGAGYYWYQNAGRNTTTISDDNFIKTRF